MEIRPEFWLLLLGVSLVTLLPRVLPLVTLNRMQMPDWMMRFLRHIPVAVMAALLAQSLLTEGEALIPLTENINLIALVPTLAVACFTRSLLAAVIAGIISMLIIRLFL
ncbi:AzlD domain-containing protein [Paenibacillus sambharensis]|uniref:AzlD domain-containing protein n=1 Tax=Paenibacillus sambharensis TaxID=1803190 RepID=A0A2W1LBR9_9BACL|nr:AzlD domain-containing protein [Paenibacillus sambharensis]PZD96169.1 AzlD domain-containing protein [Paenibacillus sambharensis]